LERAPNDYMPTVTIIGESASGAATLAQTAKDTADAAAAAAAAKVASVVAGDNVTVDNTDPQNPVISASGGGGLAERQTTSVTTSTLAAGASEDVSISLALAFRLLSLQVDGPARVEFYATTASRTADASRAIGTDPSLGSGLILEYVAPSAGTYILSPMTFGASMESSPTSSIPLRVTNTGASAAAITVTVLWEPDTATAPRNTATVTTASLTTGASGDVSLTMAETYRLLSLATDKPARVRVYATSADRSADASRPVGTDPDDTAGVMLEYVTTADALSVVLSPMVLGASMESTPSASIPVSVTNNGSAGTVTVTVIWEAAE
ncbi:MAG TPA: hypothetical protein VFM01_05060, partial [Nakamurella sp.]|nr:hypothetical protein [Nakamurella sp.]